MTEQEQNWKSFAYDQVETLQSFVIIETIDKKINDQTAKEIIRLIKEM